MGSIVFILMFFEHFTALWTGCDLVLRYRYWVVTRLLAPSTVVGFPLPGYSGNISRLDKLPELVAARSWPWEKPLVPTLLQIWIEPWNFMSFLHYYLCTTRKKLRILLLLLEWRCQQIFSVTHLFYDKNTCTRENTASIVNRAANVNRIPSCQV
jgi:hypothetical protein